MALQRVSSAAVNEVKRRY